MYLANYPSQDSPTVFTNEPKIPTDKSWDFEYWWSVGNRRQTAYELLMRANVGRCGGLSFCFIKSGEVQFYFSSTAANWAHDDFHVVTQAGHQFQ